MPTECSPKQYEFEAIGRRAVVTCFDGGNITSNAGGLLLGQVDRGLELIRRFAQCFRDRRDPRYVEHQVETLIGQQDLRHGIGLRGPQRPRRTAQGSDVPGAGREAGPCVALGLRGIGGQEHAEPP